MAVAEVGVEDNFFDLGGTSVSLARLHKKLREELPQELSITDLFANSTVRAVAKLLGHETVSTGLRQDVQDRAEKQRLARSQRGRRGRS